MSETLMERANAAREVFNAKTAAENAARDAKYQQDNETEMRWRLIDLFVEFKTHLRDEEDAFTNEIKVALQPALFEEILHAPVVYRDISGEAMPMVKVQGMHFCYHRHNVFLAYRAVNLANDWVWLRIYAALCTLMDLADAIDDPDFQAQKGRTSKDE